MISSFVAILAQAPSSPSPGGGPNFMIMMVLMFVMMYFVLIRPQRQRQKEQEKMVNSVKVGDHIVMNGGEHGIITSVKEKTIMVKLADNVKVEYERSAIASVSKKSDIVEATTA